MKKTTIYISFLLIWTFSLLLFSQSCSSSQKGIVTSKTATTTPGYTVINPGETIILYKYMHTAHSAKEADKYVPKYYFTSPTSDVLMELTKSNLKKAFPTNHAFHDALDANFNKDAELINYDEFHKMYKLNRILQSNK